MTAVVLLALAQSLLDAGGGSLYDPPKPRAWARHDRLTLVVGGPAKPGAETTTVLRLAAEVADVRPNGVLVVQALRRRILQGEVETLRLTGELAPGSVADGEAALERVANLQVAYEGTPGRTPEWLPRLFDGWGF
ncbi:MAG TPA: flagellar basal body L-ring protein FlgH [Planctomycetota bacterium]|nr:flagellar basal body L-ring protein FlgH [Planctomycetota bacterium]